MRHELRYHDGSAWTMHVLDKGAPEIDPLPVGIKLAAPHPERQPFEPPGFSGVPADDLRKRRRRRARMRSGMWVLITLGILAAAVLSWFRYFDSKFDLGGDDLPSVSTPATPTVPTVPGASLPTATSAPLVPTGSVAPAPTVPAGTAVVVVTAPATNP